MGFMGFGGTMCLWYRVWLFRNFSEYGDTFNLDEPLISREFFVFAQYANIFLVVLEDVDVLCEKHGLRNTK